MDNIKLYRVSVAYIDYLLPYAPHLYHNSQKGKQNERAYIGVVLHIYGLDHFAPLSSFKEEHRRMPEGLDFVKTMCLLFTGGERYYGMQGKNKRASGVYGYEPEGIL